MTVWHRSMKGCCEQDLQEADMKQVQNVMECGEALDEQAGLSMLHG